MQTTPFAHFEAVRLFARCGALPFIEAVGWYQAPPEFQRIPESRFHRRCLRLCIDRAHGNGRLFCPMRNEAPTHQRQFPDIVLGSWRTTGTDWVGAIL